MTKQEIRKTYLEKRKNLSEAVISQFNLQLYQLFFSSIDLSFVKVLHTYLPMEKNREPDTWMILDRIRRETNVRISIPRVSASGQLENFFFEGLHQLHVNSWGIQEPRQGVPTPDEKIDLVIVPLLAFSNSGHRVGYGKGYYDRFLKNCRPDCRKVGLSFFDAVGDISDISEQDIPLDVCITPHHAIRF